MVMRKRRFARRSVAECATREEDFALNGIHRAFLRRNTSSQVQSRRKEVNDCRLPTGAIEHCPPYIKFEQKRLRASIVLEFEGVAKSYGDQEVIKISRRMLRGEKVALIGGNGAGKHLLNALLASSPPFPNRAAPRAAMTALLFRSKVNWDTKHRSLLAQDHKQWIQKGSNVFRLLLPVEPAPHRRNSRAARTNAFQKEEGTKKQSALRAAKQRGCCSAS